MVGQRNGKAMDRFLTHPASGDSPGRPARDRPGEIRNAAFAGRTFSLAPATVSCRGRSLSARWDAVRRRKGGRDGFSQRSLPGHGPGSGLPPVPGTPMKRSFHQYPIVLVGYVRVGQRLPVRGAAGIPGAARLVCGHAGATVWLRTVRLRERGRKPDRDPAGKPWRDRPGQSLTDGLTIEVSRQ